MRLERLLRPRDALFNTAERELALLARCRPRNAEAEQARLLEAWRGDAPRLPRWSYSGRPDLAPLRAELECAVRGLSESDPIQLLYVERAQELLLEIGIVEAIGTSRLGRLAAERFVLGTPADHEGALALATDWVGAPAPAACGERVASDDAGDPRSLYCRMCRAVGELRLAFRVELSDRLSACAATGDGLILVARGRKLTENDARRIVVHEVEGHALPRHRAQQEAFGLFASSSRSGNDEQEGYALYRELCAGLLDEGRRVELALRHQAAVCVRLGADWVETVRRLLELGAELELAASIASRVHRAGGLAREIVYMPAFQRVSSAIAADASTADWLSRGRLSLEAIAVLSRTEWHGAHPELQF